MASETITTPLTKLLKIKYPILLAGMNGVSHSELAAAVSNAGGLGVIGGLSLTPSALTREITRLKELLVDKTSPFGVDLALPQIGGSARKTNHDYTHGHLPELIDIIIEEKAAVFVSAVGVPPAWAVEKLHHAGILLGNMVGAPHHAMKAIEAGMDFVIAQGGEGGGHTGEIGTMCLIRQVIEAVRGKKSTLTGDQIMVCAAGGIADGQGLAAALSLGAEGVWVGTRFICATESAAPPRHQKAVIESGALDTVKTLVVSGRPLRTFNSEYIKSWEVGKKDQIQKLCDQGIVPFAYDMKRSESGEGPEFSFAKAFPLLMGQCVGHIHEVKSAKEIVEEMMADAIETIRKNERLICRL
jgi:NAD(P)H-dependent flavin oxidoreductase YrpB (nitropropane dioxygenase family)